MAKRPAIKAIEAQETVETVELNEKATMPIDTPKTDAKKTAQDMRDAAAKLFEEKMRQDREQAMQSRIDVEAHMPIQTVTHNGVFQTHGVDMACFPTPRGMMRRYGQLFYSGESFGIRLFQISAKGWKCTAEVCGASAKFHNFLELYTMPVNDSSKKHEYGNMQLLGCEYLNMGKFFLFQAVMNADGIWQWVFGIAQETCGAKIVNGVKVDVTERKHLCAFAVDTDIKDRMNLAI